MTHSRSIWFEFLGAALLMGIGGCGGSPATVTEPESQSASEPAPDSVQVNSSSPSVPTPEAVAPRSGNSLIHQKNGKTWIGDVPLDVWFDDPLAIASMAGQTAPPPTTTTQVAEVTNPDTKPMPDPMPLPTGGIDWKRVIPGELLDAEVTTIRNRFNADLQTVGSYNSSYLGLPPHAVTLAVLSHIAAKHPDEIRWKKNAKYIKSLAGQMNAEKLRSGPSSQKPLKEKFDNIAEILNGSVPATLPAPPENESIQDVAKIGYVMKRLENASKFITVNGGTGDAMKANAAQLKQEAAVLGALTQALTDGYEDYEGDDVFAGFVKNMVDATVDMREHIQDNQFDKFELDVSKMTQSCQQCHSTYR